jgi:hypothetical protein
MAGDVEEEVGVAGEGEGFLKLRGGAVEEKGGAAGEGELGDDVVPVGEVGALFRGAGLLVRVDAFGPRDVLDHPDIPAGFAKTEDPLEEGPGVARGVQGIRRDADCDDDAGHAEGYRRS